MLVAGGGVVESLVRATPRNADLPYPPYLPYPPGMEATWR